MAPQPAEPVDCPGPAAGPPPAAIGRPRARRPVAEVRDVGVPDIGDFQGCSGHRDAGRVGDSVEAEQSLLTLESDKASMEIPSPYAGVVKSLAVKGR